MKSLLLHFAIALVFISCDQKTESEIEPKDVADVVSAKTDTGVVVQKDTLTSITNTREIKTPTLLLIARGSEPGWYAEFFTDHLRLLIDNGTDSLMLEDNFSEILNKKTYDHVITQAGNGKEQKNFSLAVKIEDKACTEEGSGEVREKSISIKYNSKTYKGCAYSK